MMLMHIPVAAVVLLHADSTSAASGIILIPPADIIFQDG